MQLGMVSGDVPERVESSTRRNTSCIATVDNGSMITCLHCSATTELPEAGARAVGWRLYSGPSQTGDLLVDSCCPACSGRTVPRPSNSHIPQASLLDLLHDNENGGNHGPG